MGELVYLNDYRETPIEEEISLEALREIFEDIKAELGWDGHPVTMVYADICSCCGQPIISE